MADSEDLYNLRNPRRFDFGSGDDDLEAMQREFLSSNTKPAAKVVRLEQGPPSVQSHSESLQERGKSSDTPGSGSGSGSGSRSDRGPPQHTTSSDLFGFAQRMADAISDFEVRERMVDTTNSTDLSETSKNQLLQHTPKKKMSLFAQRRLAKQAHNGPTALPVAVNGSGGAAATFLPKLMAPVPEHTVVSEPMAPQLAERETGFPQVPVDFSLEMKAAKASPPLAAPNEKGSNQADTYWTCVREQISQENEDRIKSMTAAEIADAQSEIKSMLSSDLIQRLVHRKQKAAKDPAPEIESTASSAAEPKKKPAKQVRFSESSTSAITTESPDTNAQTVIPPPPPAEWVDSSGSNMAGCASKEDGLIDADNCDTGLDSEFYSDMKRKYFPSEVVEEAKLAWILGHRQSSSPMERGIHEARKRDAVAAAAAATEAETEGNGVDQDPLSKPSAHVRFAFDGQIMTEDQAEIPTQAGLHHHGDDPDKPGYTIPELLHLSRSTVPAQRSIALSVLGCIFHKINVGAWDMRQSVEIYVCLLDWQTELYLAQGISDHNMTCRAEATLVLWTWVVEMARYKSLVRLVTGGQVEVQSTGIPGAAIKMHTQPVTAKGTLVSRTFKAFDSIVTPSFMDRAYEAISRSTMPEQQLVLLSECIKYLMGMSEEFGQRIKENAKLVVLLQNKYPYVMNK
ncbi:hypothetical protein GGI07_005644 [Coemansia sp. Benny D115]|nr:hypothetical protein GGI07_005644 [Coemansia sp. Benny D115]